MTIHASWEPSKKVRPEDHAPAILAALHDSPAHGPWRIIGSRKLSIATDLSRRTIVTTMRWLEEEGYIEHKDIPPRNNIQMPFAWKMLRRYP